MSNSKRCPIGSQHFQFELQQFSPTGLYLHTLTIEGFGCKKAGYYDADVDAVYLKNENIKPLLEVNGGMHFVDRAATEHVKEMFRNKLRKAA